jgi:beta-phosphoglucomutase
MQNQLWKRPNEQSNEKIMNRKFDAVIFDLNGTIIDDMAYHAQVWHDLLVNDLKVTITLDQVYKEMYGKNRELFIRVLGENVLTEEEMDYWSIEKEKRYQAVYRDNICPIDGFNFFFGKVSGGSI